MIAVLLISSVLAGPIQTPDQDRSRWVREIVTLYYFPSPVVLAETLNPSGKMVHPSLEVKKSTQSAGDGNPKPPNSGTGAALAGDKDSPEDQKAFGTLDAALTNHIDALNAVPRALKAIEDAKARLQKAKQAVDEAKKALIDAEARLKPLEISAKNAKEKRDGIAGQRDKIESEISQLPPDDPERDKKNQELDTEKENFTKAEAVLVEVERLCDIATVERDRAESNVTEADAVSQTSVIYAQNAMYPTIGDLSNLLSSGFGVPPLGGGMGWLKISLSRK